MLLHKTKDLSCKVSRQTLPIVVIAVFAMKPAFGSLYVGNDLDIPFWGSDYLEAKVYTGTTDAITDSMAYSTLEVEVLYFSSPDGSGGPLGWLIGSIWDGQVQLQGSFLCVPYSLYQVYSGHRAGLVSGGYTPEQQLSSSYYTHTLDCT